MLAQHPCKLSWTIRELDNASSWFGGQCRSKIFKATSSICLGASMAEWVQTRDDSIFHVPSLEEVKAINEQMTSRDDNNLNFFNNDHDKMIHNYTAKFADRERRVILGYCSQIIDAIEGSHGLENKIIVDLGIGTGVFVDALSTSVGENGCLIGLDISPSFIYHNNQMYKNQKNVRLNVCKNESLELPHELKGQIDVFWVCATYHHLGNPKAMLDEMYNYLKPGGKLVVIEFKKHGHGHGHGHKHHKPEVNDPTKLRTEWIKSHIPFTEDQAKGEIVSGGFVFDKSVLERTCTDHFIHIYKKPSFY